MRPSPRPSCVSCNREPTNREKPQIYNELSTSGLIAVNGIEGIGWRSFLFSREKEEESRPSTASTAIDSNSWTDNNEEEGEEEEGVVRALFEKRSYFSEG